MKALKIFFVTLLAAVVISGPVVARELTPEKREHMTRITPNNGFKYFSGYYSKYHNHPAMYAHGYKQNAMLTVVGRNYHKEFPMSQSGKAYSAYLGLLRQRGYEPAGTSASSGSASSGKTYSGITGVWKEYWGTPGKTDVTYNDRYRITKTGSGAYEVSIMNRTQRIYGESYNNGVLNFSQQTSFTVKYALVLDSTGQWLVGTATTPKKSYNIRWQRVQ